ncbi:hypothetical protein LTR16_004500 [Cryomyces antarcticus]|uniref:Alcohol dehydrogenase-like C-terminal domain-containing protein n=1 Tax=Cryomyces antarcticus TaxID=329879 RepID=A0ABR0M6E2_9PEZI|nr:hypothetical protein LTR60_003357 [Cryomyces antarcticus]KAK5285605.1 hypothetical protein LTR16_004500 [Cryomyces antarcticus]
MGVIAGDDGLALSREVGADVVLDAPRGRDYVVQEVRKATGGRRVDVTVNFSDAKLAAATACAIMRTFGTVVQVALPPEISFLFSEYIFRDIRVEGLFICSKKK